MALPEIGRRKFLARAGAGAGLLFLAGCDRISSAPWVTRILDTADGFTRHIQNALIGPHALATEYAVADMSPHFRANGTTNPDDAHYQQLLHNNFTDWRLEVGGLVDTPLSLSLADLRQLPSRTQITRHDCVEGWSCIGKWSGAKLSEVLDRAGVKPEAKYLVFLCADPMESGGRDKYYESVTLLDAYHPQTILAYDMNDVPLAVEHGAPIRVRLERKLGYKMAKYIMRIELADSLAGYGGGNGGYWEDQGYEWYGGI